MLLCSSVQDQLAAYNLRDDEGRAQHQAGALREAPAARPSHEDEGLADDAHLQVQGRHHLLVAAPDRSHVEKCSACSPNQDEVIQQNSCDASFSWQDMLTEKKSVLFMAQKKMTVMTAM